MAGTEVRKLAELVTELKRLTVRAQELALHNPSASSNLDAILQHLEILEIEICDPLRVLDAGEPKGERPPASD